MRDSLIDRFLHSGYELAKEISLTSIIGRFSRGNTAAQDGQVMDEQDVNALRPAGAKALRVLEKSRKRLISRTA